MPEGRTTWFAGGDWNAICDICGWKYKASELRKNWQGLMVCEKDWEPRQPQDFARGVPDVMTPPWARPQQANVFSTTNFVQLQGFSGLIAAGSTRYIASGTDSATEASVRYTMPFTGFMTTLTVAVDAAPGGSETFTYTARKNGVDVATFSGTISGGSLYTLDISGSVAVTLGDTVDIKIVTSSSAVATYHQTLLGLTT